jgi:hypothetical protein
MRNDVRVFTQPAVSSNFEQVGTLPGVRNQYPPQKVTGMGCDIFGESERGGHDVFVKEVNVVPVGVCGIVVEWEVTSQHSILYTIIRTIQNAAMQEYSPE